MGKRLPSRRALVSVSDKTGLVPFAQRLVAVGFELVSTGGTAGALRKARIPVLEVTDVTGAPEILEGRVKTLHPKIHAGILAAPDRPAHRRQLEEMGIPPIELVAVNLYPFERKVGLDGAPLREAVEFIDVGGPALVRAAAKNHAGVLVVVDPADYGDVLAALESGPGPSPDFRTRLAAKAFAHTARYDSFVSAYLYRHALAEAFPPTLLLPMRRRMRLRYGENHHQTAALYDDPMGLFGTEAGIAGYAQLHGKELSYNNLLDGDAAVEAVKEFSNPTVCIIKHVTPSGIASAKTLLQAWRDAYATDTYSPFGGVVAVNRRVDAALARDLGKVFLELVVAPDFERKALEALRERKNLRILKVPGLEKARSQGGLTMRSITGGVLVQERDTRPFAPKEWKVVTRTRPTREQWRTMLFASQCVKHVKSNAVVFATGSRTVGIGGGQTARVDASWIACYKGKENIRGSVMASEAFFPFRDAVDVAAQHGVAAIVQPGGSIRDEEVIRAADEHGMAMVFTDHRTFRH